MRIGRIRPIDSGTLLIRALRQHARAAGCTIHVESLALRPRASATFIGAQHRVVLCAAASDALSPWLAGLPEAELPLTGHLVADLVVESDRCDGDVRRVTLAALTLEEG